MSAPPDVGDEDKLVADGLAALAAGKKAVCVGRSGKDIWMSCVATELLYLLAAAPDAVAAEVLAYLVAGRKALREAQTRREAVH